MNERTRLTKELNVREHEKIKDEKIKGRKEGKDSSTKY